MVAPAHDGPPEPARRDQLSKAVHILSVLAETGPRTCGVRELANHTNMAPSTVHRVLSALEGLRLVRAEDGRYGLGMEAFRLALQTTQHFPLASVAAPPTRRLVDACEESALLGAYDPIAMDMMYVGTVESARPWRYVVDLYRRLPLHAGAGGLSILAFLPENERGRYLRDTDFKRLTDRTIISRRGLDAEVRRIREAGYAVSIGAHIPGAVGIAAPIVVGDRPLGHVMLTLPESRYDPSQEDRFAPRVRQCAQEIAQEL
jgi:DNA-binding IclR family transcriptional regulator